jgi:hypothetical protein
MKFIENRSVDAEYILGDSSFLSLTFLLFLEEYASFER